MPIDYRDYPENWKSELRPAVLTRANNACENCGVKNYDVVRWNEAESRYESHLSVRPKNYKTAKRIWSSLKTWHDWKVIVLTIAHLDHDVKNNEMDNLKALCQRCHLNYDRADNARRRRYGKHYHKNQLKVDFNRNENEL